MVQIHALLVLKSQDKKPIILTGYVAANDWTTYFFKNYVAEYVEFFAKTLALKTPPGTRIQVKGENNGKVGDFIGYIHSRMSGFSTVLITDQDYPSRIAFNILQKISSDFEEYNNWKSRTFDEVTKDYELDHMYLKYFKKYVSEYQDPIKTDKILQIKKDLEETKTIMLNSIDSLLDRGEKLEKLVEQTDLLSGEAKIFYKKAEGMNCCTIL